MGRPIPVCPRTSREMSRPLETLVCTRVSNGTGVYNFSGQETEVSSLSRDKGKTGQAQNLAMGR